MYIPVLLTCLYFILLAYLVSGNLYNYVSAFNIVWFIMILLNAMNLFNTSEIATYVWMLVLISDLAFSVPGLALLNSWKQGHQVMCKDVPQAIEIKDGLNNNITSILNCVCLLYLVYRTLSVIALLSRGYSYSVIRIMYNWGPESELGVSAIETMFRMYFVTPYIYVQMGIVAISISNRKETHKDNKRRFILFTSLICVGLYALATASRIELFLMAFEITFVWAIRRKRDGERRKLSKIQKAIIIFGLAISLYLSESRGGESFSIIRTFGSYFGLQLHHLDIRLATFLSEETYTYGLCTLMGLIRFPMTVLYALILRSPYPQLYEYASNVGVGLQSSVSLATDVTFNAFVTPIYYLYVDGGVTSVIIGFALFAVICSRAYRNFIKDTNSNRNLMLYLLILTSMYYILVRWPFYRPQYLFAFVYSMALYPLKRPQAMTRPTNKLNEHSINTRNIR